MIGLIVVVGGPIGTGGAATGAEEATVVMPGAGTVERYKEDELDLKKVCQERLQILWNTSNAKSKLHIGKNLTQTIQNGCMYPNHAEFIERINQVNIYSQSEESTEGSFPVLYLPSSNPLNAEGVPCILRAYTVPIVIKDEVHFHQDSLYISDANYLEIILVLVK